MFDKLLCKLAGTLSESGIPYMIIGGQAVLLHGEARATMDIDVTLGVDIDAFERVLSAMTAVGIVSIPEDPEAFARKTMVLPLKDPESGIRVDFIFSFLPYERQAIERSVAVDMGAFRVQFASVEDLLIHKIIAGRPRDIEDARGVLLKNPGIDKEYIERWLADFEEAMSMPYPETFANLLAGTA